MSEDRAVSDALGFILVFGIIVSTVAVVYVGGFNALDNARQYERMNNAERAFEVFADNIEDLTQRNAPSRATEIKLSEASLESGDPQEIEINVTRANAHAKSYSVTPSYEPIVYTSETDPSNRMVYSLGATFRASSGGTVMATEPPWILNSSRVIIPIIDTNAQGTTLISGSTTVLVRTAVEKQTVVVQNTTEQSDVWINVTSSRNDAWRSYMDRHEAVDCDNGWGAADTLNCRITEVDVLYITYIQINYEFE